MTRWWAYAVVTIALVCGGVTHPEVSTTEGPSELCKASTPKPATARKRSCHATPLARRSMTGPLVAIVSPVLDLAPPRVWIADAVTVVESRAERVVAIATARGPPA